MRVVALISGGKDSCYNAMQCVAAGHSVVALANLHPVGKDELDSYMFQTVGHEAVEYVAKAMELPLYRMATSGRSKRRGLQYEKEEGDEVEDLFKLLHLVQRSERVEGVASGAVLSDYQRLRVEHVCERLGLTSLSYLWRRDQSVLLDDMVAGGVNAVLVKVAAIGLNVDHLGCSLLQMKPHLSKLNRDYGVHMCGEGGEYETITLDCPLFTHSIFIEEKEVVMVTEDELAPVAYLKLKKLQLIPKSSLRQCLPSLPSTEIRSWKPYPTRHLRYLRCNGGEGKVWKWSIFEGRGDCISEQTTDVLSHMSKYLTSHGNMLKDVAQTHLSLSSMDDFSVVNSLYKPLFSSSPPARVCVQCRLPPGVLVRLEILLYSPDLEREEEKRDLVTMHVQSVSCWAPANIGPYSQAVIGGDVVLIAGQIGLDSATMSLVAPDLQPALALNHVSAVLQANGTDLTFALCGICYYTTEEAGWASRMTWSKERQKMNGCGPAVVFAKVPALPRAACVEWTFVAVVSSSNSPPSYHARHVVLSEGILTAEEVMWYNRGKKSGVWLYSIRPHSPELNLTEAVGLCLEELRQTLRANDMNLNDISVYRLFIPHFTSSMFDNTLSELRLFPAETSVTVCEGYFGQNCCLSLLAQLLPS